MPVPESIRAVPRPRNTVVVDSGHEGDRRYAVRERSGVKYGPGGRSRPINGRVIGHICNDVFVPVGTIAPTASKGPDELSYGAAAFVYSETTDLLHDLLAVYPPEDAYAMLKENYDGYHFSEDDTPGIYNPFSILNALDKKKLGSYWFETGTPTYLVELLKKHNYNLSDLEKEEPTADELNSIDSDSTNPIPVIYQSGYLTIKGYDKEFSLYKLGYPNKEVEEGFVKFLIPYYTNVEKTKSGFEISQFVLCLRNKDIEGFMVRLQAFLSNCPYELQPDQERHFQSVMYILTTLCGFYAEVEEHTSKGRMDMTIRTDRYIYIFEFKFNSSADIALKQIEDMGYADKFNDDNREVVCIGVNYCSKERNVNSWRIK